MYVPSRVLHRIKQSCTMKNVRGAPTWRSKNDGTGHKSDIMKSLEQARKAEWFVWKKLSSLGYSVTEPNFERDTRASADLKVIIEDTTYDVEVKSCAAKKRDRNGYQLQVRRKHRGRLKVVDPWVRNKTGGNTLFFCVIVSGNKCTADTIFGMRRKDLVCTEPNRADLRGLKLAIHPRLQTAHNIIS